MTTFSEPLAQSLSTKLAVLAPETGGIVPRITVSDLRGTADELFQLIHGRRPWIVATDMLRTMIAKAAEAAGIKGFTSRFLLSEWTNVVDAWGIDGLERYASVPRLGRRSPLGPRQRERLWSVFGLVAATLREQGVFTRAEVCREVASHYAGRERKPFDNIIVDEAQDLGPAELSFLAAIAPGVRTRCFLPATSASAFFNTRFRGKPLASKCGGARGVYD